MNKEEKREALRPGFYAAALQGLLAGNVFPKPEDGDDIDVMSEWASAITSEASLLAEGLIDEIESVNDPIVPKATGVTFIGGPRLTKEEIDAALGGDPLPDNRCTRIDVKGAGYIAAPGTVGFSKYNLQEALDMAHRQHMKDLIESLDRTADHIGGAHHLKLVAIRDALAWLMDTKPEDFPPEITCWADVLKRFQTPKKGE